MKLIEEEELLAGFLILTENHLGKASILLGKIKNATVKAIRAQIKQNETPQLDTAIKETAKQETLKRFEGDLKKGVKPGKKARAVRLEKQHGQKSLPPG